MATQGVWPANDKEVQKVLRRMGRTPPEDDNEKMTQRPAAYRPPTARQETFCQKADDEDEKAQGLMEAEFYERLQDPKVLYQKLVELIQRMRDLKVFSKNYRKQLYEVKQTLRNNTVENKLCGNADAYPTKDLKIIYMAGRVSGDALALISPHLWTANRHAYGTVNELYEHLEELYGDPNKECNAHQAFKDLAMRKEQTFQEFYSTFLHCIADGNISPRDLKDNLNNKLTWKLQGAVATYYNDLTITLSQFARYCIINDQQIWARLEKRDWTTRKPDGTRKTTTE
ncbi:hypothetical protein GP486_006362 [Trichoglossum hirsutum]|uniref:Retrotransposon gag domain-containing protein n=1 Tax=Trichoglossum hirsutum TaxID=265104 RepID=A0A9P8L7I0_9PEZI|nr:hypothetical protein GP486_006362 [Trichoglossum hirsutum]